MIILGVQCISVWKEAGNALKQSNILFLSKISILWLLFYLEYIGHSELSHIKHLSEVLKPNKIWKFLTKFDIWRDHGLWVVTKSYSPKLGEQLGGRLSPGMYVACALCRVQTDSALLGRKLSLQSSLPLTQSSSGGAQVKRMQRCDSICSTNNTN